jgi:hypothetical protein
MVAIDEKMEAIARIRMAVNNDVQARQIESGCDAEETPEAFTNNESNLQQWQFGSPDGKRADFQVLLNSEECSGTRHREYHNLDQRLRDFIAFHFPEEALSYEDDIFVSSPLLIS